jgi:hypothetical protein
LVRLNHLRAPQRHLVVDVTVTCARTNTDVPHIGARLPLPGSLALGAQHGKLDADLRTSALLGTPSVQSLHDYNPFAPEDGGRLAPTMAGELVDCIMPILVAIRRFHGMVAAYSRTLRSGTNVRIQHFVRRSTVLHKIPDMHYVKHKLVKSTLPSHHVKHDDTRVPPNCRRAEKQAVSRHPGW